MTFNESREGQEGDTRNEGVGEVGGRLFEEVIRWDGERGKSEQMKLFGRPLTINLKGTSVEKSNSFFVENREQRA